MSLFVIAEAAGYGVAVGRLKYTPRLLLLAIVVWSTVALELSTKRP